MFWLTGDDLVTSDVFENFFDEIEAQVVWGAGKKGWG